MNCCDSQRRAPERGSVTRSNIKFMGRVRVRRSKGLTGCPDGTTPATAKRRESFGKAGGFLHQVNFSARLPGSKNPT